MTGHKPIRARHASAGPSNDPGASGPCMAAILAVLDRNQWPLCVGMRTILRAGPPMDYGDKPAAASWSNFAPPLTRGAC